jgi:NosR/NirI family nitrous oxide reductase transcriptional regulator
MKFIGFVLLLCASLCCAVSASARTVLQDYLPSAVASDFVPGAEGFGPIREDLAVAPVLKGGETVAWVFVTSDFVGTTGYSGKPIHTLVAVGKDAKIIGVRLVKHSEPIVLIGIPEAKVKALVAGYAGLDLAAEAKSGGTAHEVDIISGATVTVMVIDDSIVRSGLKVARALGLGGLAPEKDGEGPRFPMPPPPPTGSRPRATARCAGSRSTWRRSTRPSPTIRMRAPATGRSPRRRMPPSSTCRRRWSPFPPSARPCSARPRRRTSRAG